MGDEWSFSYGTHLVVNSSAGTATVVLGNGSQIPFTLLSGAYSAPDWVMATLTQNADGSFTYLEKRTQRRRTARHRRRPVGVQLLKGVDDVQLLPRRLQWGVPPAVAW